MSSTFSDIKYFELKTNTPCLVNTNDVFETPTYFVKYKNAAATFTEVAITSCGNPMIIDLVGTGRDVEF